MESMWRKMAKGLIAGTLEGVFGDDLKGALTLMVGLNQGEISMTELGEMHDHLKEIVAEFKAAGEESNKFILARQTERKAGKP
jgi:hypothetical protein